MGLLLGPFIQNGKYVRLKFTGELCVITNNEEWFKVWTKTYLSVQIWHEEFDEF